LWASVLAGSLIVSSLEINGAPDRGLISVNVLISSAQSFSFGTPSLSPSHNWWLGFTVVSHAVNACWKNVRSEQLMDVLIAVEGVHDMLEHMF
jgi:hypothetical protein